MTRSDEQIEPNREIDQGELGDVNGNTMEEGYAETGREPQQELVGQEEEGDADPQSAPTTTPKSQKNWRLFKQTRWVPQNQSKETTSTTMPLPVQ